MFDSSQPSPTPHVTQANVSDPRESRSLVVLGSGNVGTRAAAAFVDISILGLRLPLSSSGECAVGRVLAAPVW
jgi:hypothetical protein